MQFPAAPIDVATALICVAIVPAISVWNGVRLSRTPAFDRALAGRYLWVIVRSVIITALIVSTWMRFDRPFSALGLDFPIGTRGLMGFGADALIVLYYLYAIVLRQRSDAELEVVAERLRRMRSDRMMPRHASDFRLYAVMAVVGSIAEELAYRGFLIWFFNPIFGLAGAVLAASLAFALGHAYLGWRGVVRTALIGLAFGVAFTATRSLWWLMIAHVTANVSGLPLQRRLHSIGAVRTT